MKLRKLLIAAFLLTGLTALAYQVATRITPRPAPAAMSAMLPQGALLTIESPDFAALLRSWNRSAQQKAWLASDDYSVFSNSRLFGRLNDARAEFETAARPNAKDDAPDLFDADFLTQVAGRQSIFAWYDVGNLEFLYVSRLPAAQAAKISLLRIHPGFAQRQSGGHTFYVRKSTGTDSTPRTVAFAQVPSPSGTLLILATREDLIAGALALIASPGNSVATEPWYTDAQTSLPAESKPPALHMVLNLDRLVPLPAFHTYWVQQNVSQMKQYRAAVSDLYPEGGSFREERSILLKSASPEPGNPSLTSLAALAPQTSGIFRTTATHDPGLAITALEEKLLGRVKLEKLPDTQALDPDLAAQQAGSTDDLETRIDAPAPVSQTFSNQALAETCKTAGLDAVLTWSTALPPATPAGLWVPIHSAVILHGTNPWNPQTLQTALQQSLRGSLTTATLGIDFRPGDNNIYALTGPRPLFFAIRENTAFFSDDRPTLTTLLAQTAPPPGTDPATQGSITQIAGFDHASQRAPYARLTSLIDGNNQTSGQPDAGAGDTPAYFSRNLKSLSDSFAALASEHFIERTADTPAGPALHQTVTYQWRRP